MKSGPESVGTHSGAIEIRNKMRHYFWTNAFEDGILVECEIMHEPTEFSPAEAKDSELSASCTEHDKVERQISETNNNIDQFGKGTDLMTSKYSHLENLKSTFTSSVGGPSTRIPAVF